MALIRNVYVCGLGSLGGMYASRLAPSSATNLKVIADPGRIARYKAQGVSVNNRHIKLDFLTPNQSAPVADLLMVAVKWHQLNQAIGQIRPFVGDKTVILSLLNGIESEEVVEQALGCGKVLRSFVVETDAGRTGSNTHYKTLGTIVFDERSNDAASRDIIAVRNLFDDTGIPYRVPKDMLRELWWKFMLTVGINQTSAVMRAPYGTFQEAEEARELLRMAFREVLQIAQKDGIALEEKDIESLFPIFARLSPTDRTSMLQDVETCRKTEVEIFAGSVMERGLRYGIPTPVNSTLFNMIRTIEKTYPSKMIGRC